jgi:hypothetical protein
LRSEVADIPQDVHLGVRGITEDVERIALFDTIRVAERYGVDRQQSSLERPVESITHDAQQRQIEDWIPRLQAGGVLGSWPAGRVRD